MNIARTQYIEHNFAEHQTIYRMFLSLVFAVKKILVQWQAILQNGLVPILSLVVIFVSVVGYVAAINFTMLRGASLRQVQKEIKLIETGVLQKETALANSRTRASLEKHESVALMQNVDHVFYTLPNTSVADASGYQSIR